MNKLLHNLGRYWFLILIGGIIVFAMFSGSDNSQPLPPPSSSSQSATADATAAQSVPSTPAVSLDNGTILKQRSYYVQGDGTLEIDNGTGSDAVAKLIADGTSVFTVYIKAGSNYTIKNITDGTYWLAFALGSDWDSTTNTFNQSAGYSSFADTFDFTTSNTQYTTFTVTLNPVEGGTAQTNNVDPQQFSAY
ncbi:MAG TPA: hypothetical protein VMC41_03775 [Candidatus Nanoarchaeia archaeon]|nr:hypothetical protein [Candidatus Nanoarchaeia archaeon]